MQKGIIVAKRDSIKKHNVPLMVIILDGMSVTAIGDPDTSMDLIAKDHHDTAAQLSGDMKAEYIQNLYDHYTNYSGSGESGYAYKIVDYTGSGKKEVDKIKNDFMNRRVDRFLNRKRNTNG